MYLRAKMAGMLSNGEAVIGHDAEVTKCQAPSRASAEILDNHEVGIPLLVVRVEEP